MLNAQFFILLLGFLLAAGPLLLYALNQQAAFNDRVSGVFLLSDEALKGQPALAALDETLGRHLLMFNVRGDENGRHAPPGQPALDFISGLGFLLGCGLALRSFFWRRDWRGVFLLLALALSLLPSALAVDAPHGMRSIGAAAFACAIAALGWLWLEQLVGAEQAASKAIFFIALRSALVVLVIALNVYTYFFWMRTSPDVWVSFYPVHTQAGAYVRELREQEGDRRQVYIGEGVAANPVFVYLSHGLAVQTFSDTTLSEPLRPGALFVLSGYTYTKDRDSLAAYIGSAPQPVAVGPLFPDGRGPSFVVYEARPCAKC